VTVLHNLYSDREGTVPFTQEVNEKYIDTENNYHYLQNKKINNERFVDSWEVIVKHTKEHIQPFPADKPRKPKAREPG
jgi:predicted glycosyltransferase involved in capsule biosynthesis